MGMVEPRQKVGLGIYRRVGMVVSASGFLLAYLCTLSPEINLFTRINFNSIVEDSFLFVCVAFWWYVVNYKRTHKCKSCI